MKRKIVVSMKTPRAWGETRCCNLGNHYMISKIIYQRTHQDIALNCLSVSISNLPDRCVNPPHVALGKPRGGTPLCDKACTVYVLSNILDMKTYRNALIKMCIYQTLRWLSKKYWLINFDSLCNNEKFHVIWLSSSIS